MPVVQFCIERKRASVLARRFLGPYRGREQDLVTWLKGDRLMLLVIIVIILLHDNGSET